MTPVPTLRCKCTFEGPSYAFVSINGAKPVCVTCAGSQRIKPSARMVRDMNRGRKRGSRYERMV
jgi:hypothetical protein